MSKHKAIIGGGLLLLLASVSVLIGQRWLEPESEVQSHREIPTSKPDIGEECFNRIQVGMPYEEAKLILLESGYVFAYSDREEENTLVYTRPKSGNIYFGVNWMGIVSYKELSAPSD